MFGGWVEQSVFIIVNYFCFFIILFFFFNDTATTEIYTLSLHDALPIWAKKGNILMVDSSGVIQKSRKGLSEQKKQFATSKKVSTLKDALKGADVFLGLSVADVVTTAMVKSMARNPIVFACANPEIGRASCRERV